ncbi:MAG: response regulator [Lachnospiraceae bacterium]|nr:response regulator [Lachnospiraceae bacterium]
METKTEKKLIEKTSTHMAVVTCSSVVTLGLMVNGVLEGWEGWMLPVLLAGMAAMWFLHVTQFSSENFREWYYLIFAMAMSFYHAVHDSSFFDVAVVSAILIITFTLLNSKAKLGMLFGEFIVVFIVQANILFYRGVLTLDYLTVYRMLLHFAAIFCVFFVCRKLCRERVKIENRLEKRNMAVEEYEREMDDFLTNISHELRTPVNVINGISALLLKNETNDDIASIRDAGIRLSRQIEDISDYTEIQGENVILENDKYMITSLINDVLVAFSLEPKRDKLEFVVDLDPNVPTMMRGDLKRLQRIMRHLIDNAFKFTARGGVYVKISTIKRDYGVNLCISVRDTGIGMSRNDVSHASSGMYQANKKRNRSTGGIGLGLSVVWGFVHAMHGFVKIESEPTKGTTVYVSVPQEVVDPSPCLALSNTSKIKNIVFFVMPEKYRVPEVRDFYRMTATNIAAGLKVNLFAAASRKEVEQLMEKMEISHVFMGDEEYTENTEFIEDLAKKGITVAISSHSGFKVGKDSRAIIMRKPLYGYPVVKILNGITDEQRFSENDDDQKPNLAGVRALVVDDEPMNLVVATGLFKEYGMVTDTANSGRESIDKYSMYDYDVIFMDHMMPGMDGVEAMKHIKEVAEDTGRVIPVVALTANAVGGAREMFRREGFDGFISKPIDIKDFERTMRNVLSSANYWQKKGEGHENS